MRRLKIYKIGTFIILAFLVFGLSLPGCRADSATLFLAPASGTKVINTQFAVSIRVNTGGEVINAAQGTISFDNNLLEAVGVSKNGSIFSLWTAEPSYDNGAGTISFGGGIPQPGYSGNAGTIFSVTFKAKRAGSAAVRFSSGAVLANDGKGTNILASMGSASFTIAPASEAPKPAAESKPAQPEAPKVEAEYNKPEIKSSTHPDQNKWYREDKIKFSWELSEGVTGVSIGFDKEPGTDPGHESDGLFSEKDYEKIGTGVWYLHLKFKDNRRWGTTAHYRVMIDINPPRPFEVKIEPTEIGQWPVLNFDTTDEESGLDHWEIIIGSLEKEAYMVEAEKDKFQTEGLEAGEHTALVKAIDKAGNEAIATVTFNVEPLAAPVIVNYAREIRSDDNFFISGTALPDLYITVYILKDDKIITQDVVASDKDGNWFYIHPEKLENERYFAYVEAKNKLGIKSRKSETVSFIVSPPIFTQVGGFIINYFTVLASLLFLIILIIVLIFFLAGLIRRKLKKETVEIEEVLGRNLKTLKQSIDKDLDDLEKYKGKQAYSQEKAKTANQIKSNIDEAGKRILKEIKDVEDILK